jgi:PTH1 family peptidyl-tRNA hydrolase
VKIIVGLGNPGLRYRRTRHNIGFMVVGALARQRRLGFRRGRFRSTQAQGHIGKESVVLVRPQTFMNLSGRSVAPLVRETGCSLEDLLIVCDDVNLDLGVLRLRRQGSAGGHKGLHSIIHNLHSQAFPRLRLGVGRPPQGADMMDYVLHPFRRAERPIVDHVVEQAVQAIQTWAYHGIEEAMNRFNQRVPPLVDNG